MKKTFRFTLIELLVVIAVISILAGMLLPALGKARERVKTILCVGNERQLYLGVAGYANDNEGYTTSSGSTRSITQTILWRDLYGGADTKYGIYNHLVGPGYCPVKVLRCPARPDVKVLRPSNNYDERWDLLVKRERINGSYNINKFYAVSSYVTRSQTFKNWVGAAGEKFELGTILQAGCVRLGDTPSYVIWNDMDSVRKNNYHARVGDGVISFEGTMAFEDGAAGYEKFIKTSILWSRRDVAGMVSGVTYNFSIYGSGGGLPTASGMSVLRRDNVNRWWN